MRPLQTTAMALFLISGVLILVSQPLLGRTGITWVLSKALYFLGVLLLWSARDYDRSASR